MLAGLEIEKMRGGTKNFNKAYVIDHFIVLI